MAGGEFLSYNNSIFLSERETADRNYSLAYYMKEKDIFPKGFRVQECMDFYFKVCFPLLYHVFRVFTSFTKFTNLTNCTNLTNFTNMVGRISSMELRMLRSVSIVFPGCSIIQFHFIVRHARWR